MCSFPAREARIGRVVFAISSPIMGGFSRWDVLSDNSLSSKLPEVFGPAPEIVSGLLSQRAEQVWRDWNPLAWRFMRKRRGCFGRAAEQTSCHAGAPRPTFSWNALADILAAPALSVSNVFLRRRANSNTISDLDKPESLRSGARCCRIRRVWLSFQVHASEWGLGLVNTGAGNQSELRAVAWRCAKPSPP